MPETVPKPNEMQELGRLTDGKIQAPDRYVQYEGQVIVRTRYSTSQRWITEGWDRRTEVLPYLLTSEYCTGEPGTVAPMNDHLADEEIEVYYVRDSETVFYRVVDDG